VFSFVFYYISFDWWMCAFVVRFCFSIPSQEIGLENVPRWPVLYWVGRRTTTQSIIMNSVASDWSYNEHKLPDDDKTSCEGVNLITLADCCVCISCCCTLVCSVFVVPGIVSHVFWGPVICWIMRAEGSMIVAYDSNSSGSYMTIAVAKLFWCTLFGCVHCTGCELNRDCKL